jgi:glutaredoxin
LLSQAGVAFEYYNVDEDEQARRELVELGFMGTPVTVIGGQSIKGFDRAKLEAAIAELR